MAERRLPLPPLVPAPDRLFWTRGTSLTARILAVNVIALGLMAGSLFYLDSYRKGLLAERYAQARAEASIVADAIAAAPPGSRDAILTRIGSAHAVRLRLYDPAGAKVSDSFALAPPAYRLVDPAAEPVLLRAARWLDRGMDFVLRGAPVPPYVEPQVDDAADWPELVAARHAGQPRAIHRYAPDRTPMINAAAPIGGDGTMLLATRNSRDITQAVRDARQTLAIVIAVTLLISIQLSLFLARTIVKPLRLLVRAAIRVRLGRDRQVEVPRLPERRDEIGLLARALSDMTAALRQRTDAVERFAADVAHEIKNPLASLRSALEAMGRVTDPELRDELASVAEHDVRRIDRLVTEIAEASRIDAELSRTQFVPLDLLALARSLVATREARSGNGPARVEVAAAGEGPFTVAGDPPRLERVLHNLIDNAVSFAPPGSAVTLEVSRHGDDIVLSVADEGPGIPVEAREKVFERFHSLRPAEEAFGSHSGLGLAIARTIAEAHDGGLTAVDPPPGEHGARLVLTLPAAEG
jgi:two-component system sensor histidine kinase ChvG